MGAIRRGIGVVTVATGLLGAACGGGDSTGGATTTAAPTSTSSSAQAMPLISWMPHEAEAANGEAPRADAAASCGSDTATYLTEILDVSPTDAKVLHEWADVVEGGKQVMISGEVETTHLGPADLPMSHPYGDDLSMNVSLEEQFAPFSQQLGEEQGEEKPGSMHVEIASGFIPHERGPTGEGTHESWRQASDRDLTGFLNGFRAPAVGDPVLIQGRWIIDCGHGDYATELHAMSFLAWAQESDGETVAHVYFNPYRDTELYGPDMAQLGRVDDASRFDDPAVKTFPPYFVDEFVRLLSGESDHLVSRELIESVRHSPARWQVCAPGSATGGDLSVSYDFVARPGVEIEVIPDNATGCATVRTQLTDDYSPLDARLRLCALPWDYLDEITADAVGSEIEVSEVVKQYVPESAHTMVDREPETACADPLAGPSVASAPNGDEITVDETQPFPFYGVITAARSG